MTDCWILTRDRSVFLYDKSVTAIDSVKATYPNSEVESVYLDEARSVVISVMENGRIQDRMTARLIVIRDVPTPLSLVSATRQEF